VKAFSCFAILLLLGLRAIPVSAQEPTVTPEPTTTEDDPSGGGYEIDYEEEPDTTTQTPSPTATPIRRPRDPSNPAVQGTHSSHHFAPMMKSETKSVYKKNGKTLDVDTD